MKNPSTNRINHLSELYETIQKYNIGKNDFCIIGSSVLALYGIRENNDIDIFVRPEVSKRICAENGFSPSEIGIIRLSENIDIKIFGYSDIGIEKNLLEDEYSTIFDGLKFLKIEIEFARKVTHFREIDQEDLPAMEILLEEKIDWNWDLVRDTLFSFNNRDNSEEKSQKTLTHLSKLARSFSSSLSRVGLFQTILLTKKYLSNSFRNFSRLIPILGRIDKRKYDRVFLADIDSGKIGIGSALSLQRKKHKFSRYDIFVRTMLFNEISKGNISENSFYDYEIMQKKRSGINSNQSCLALFDSIKERGITSDSGISINKQGMLLDGSHRLSCSISLGFPEIPFEINRVDPGGKKFPTYPRAWFKRGVFDKSQLDRVDKYAYECFLESGVLFPIILWPPGQSFSNMVCEELQKFGWIAHKSTLDLGESFQDFVQSIYSCDVTISPWKVHLKKELLRKYGQTVEIIFFDPNNPRFRIKDSSNKALCTSMESVKKHLRSSMEENMEEYYYDICLHSSDNYDQNAQSILVMKKFGWSIRGPDHLELEEFKSRFF